jgi:hypothetical protein
VQIPHEIANFVVVGAASVHFNGFAPEQDKKKPALAGFWLLARLLG